MVMATMKTLSRILTFDLMRGYFLVAIILDHLYFFPSGLEIWSARGDLYVSAAEGFFIISGLVLGIIRGRRLIDQPFRVATKLLLKRSVQLYISAVVLMLIFTFIGWHYSGNPGLKPGLMWEHTDIWTLIWGALTFQYLYGWADYLRLYAIFIFFSPIALFLLRKGFWWVVLAISAGIWALFPFSTLATDELSQVYSWQLIFFTGFVIGYHFENITAWWRRLTLTTRRYITASILGLALVTVVTNIIIVFGAEFNPTLDAIHNVLQPSFNKERLPIPRLALFALWFSASFLLFKRFEVYIMKYMGWLLLPFGMNSLYIYILQAFAVFFVNLYFIPTNWALNLLVSVSTVGIIWVAVHYKFLMKIIPR